jgi:DNA-binding transcriptional MerR regulator
MNTNQQELTLEELSQEVDRLLREKGIQGGHSDHRISSVPDARTIRYYATLGLLDRPLIVGRQARYGELHVMQLLVIKALQVAGMPLAEIQKRIYGRSFQELQAIVDAIEKMHKNSDEKASEEISILHWHEIVLQPGIKLMVEESFSHDLDAQALETQIRAAVAALRSISKSRERG